MKGQHYYDQLTPEQQERWQKNISKHGHPGDYMIYFMEWVFADLKSFLTHSFVWEETPEGGDYWLAIANGTATRPYNSGVLLGLFIGVITGTLLSMATRDWTYQLIGLDILLMAGIVYLYRRYRNEHPQGR